MKKLTADTMQLKTTPRHIAIIMDGNRRWARGRGKAILFGHQYAVDHVLEPLVDAAIAHNVSCLTFWAWSTENWRRTKAEVTAIMTLFRRLFDEHIERLHRKGVRVQTIGDVSAFAPDIQKKVSEAKEKTKNNDTITVIFAINYGGRDELVRAARASQKSKVKSQKLTEQELERHLDTAGLPSVDLIIRPGGEKRLSGFLLWQSAYAELYFTDVLFPDFGPAELAEAIAEFRRRERRYGR